MSEKKNNFESIPAFKVKEFNTEKSIPGEK